MYVHMHELPCVYTATVLTDSDCVCVCVCACGGQLVHWSAVVCMCVFVVMDNSSLTVELPWKDGHTHSTSR